MACEPLALLAFDIYQRCVKRRKYDLKGIRKSPFVDYKGTHLTYYKHQVVFHRYFVQIPRYKRIHSATLATAVVEQIRKC